MQRIGIATAVLATLSLTAGLVPAAQARAHAGSSKTPKAHVRGATAATGAPASTTTTSTAPTFSSGQLQGAAIGASGCGTNVAGEPAIHVSRADNVFLGSENGIGGGSALWRGLGSLGGPSAQACSLTYQGQPNAVSGFGASGGDIDIALASAINALGNYNVYVASLNLGSINVASSQDNGSTFTQVPVVGGIPVDDREWIAAFGANTSLLSYHDVATGDIDILRSDNGGTAYTQTGQAIPLTDYKSGSNELGNLVIDHRNLPDQTGNFYAYQSFVAPSASGGSSNNEAFLAVSADGGKTWTDQPIPCSTASATTSLNHQFPNVSVAPNGTLWYAWSDDKSIYTATSSDHGKSWACSGAVSTGSVQAIEPWLVAGANGVDLAFYGTPSAASNQVWYAEMAQNTTGTATGWQAPQQIVPVHQGTVCESGATCTTGRQLFDDFGVDTDSLGYAHIAYSHDSPALGGAGTYTGSAVQTGGTTIGSPNN